MLVSPTYSHHGHPSVVVEDDLRVSVEERNPQQMAIAEAAAALCEYSLTLQSHYPLTYHGTA